MKFKTWLASAVLVLCLFQPALTANSLQFVGANVFPSDARASEYTAPDAAWSFSFVVDDHPVPQVLTDAGFDVIFSNFNYSLDGAVIPVTPQIRFFSSDLGGMLDIGFENSADVDMDPITGLAFIGPGIFTGSTSEPILQMGSYTATGGVFWVDSFPVQSLTGTVVDVGALSDTTVPEPGTGFELTGAGLCFVATAIIRRVWGRKS